MRTHSYRGKLRTLIISIVAMTALVPLADTSRAAAQEQAGGNRRAVVTVQGMQCPFCAYGIQKHLKRLPGATRVEVELAKNQAIVTFEPDAKVTDEDIQQAIRKAGFTPDKIEWRSAEDEKKRPAESAARDAEQTARFAIEGMRCLGCEAKITADLEAQAGVSLAQVDWQEGTATVRYRPETITPEEVRRVIENAGKFQAKLQPTGGPRNQD